MSKRAIDLGSRVELRERYEEGWIPVKHAARACEKAFRRGFQQGWDEAFRCDLTPSQIEKYSSKIADWRFKENWDKAVYAPTPNWKGRRSDETSLERLDMEYIEAHLR